MGKNKYRIWQWPILMLLGIVLGTQAYTAMNTVYTDHASSYVTVHADEKDDKKDDEEDDKKEDKKPAKVAVNPVAVGTIYQSYLLSSGDLVLEDGSDGMVIPNLGYGGVKLQFSAGKMRSSFSSKDSKAAADMFTRTMNTYSEYGYVTNWSGGMLDMLYMLGRGIFGGILVIFAIIRLAFIAILAAVVSIFRQFDVLGQIANVLATKTSSDNFLMKALGLTPAVVGSIFALAFSIGSISIVFALRKAMSEKGQVISKSQSKMLLYRILTVFSAVAMLIALNYITTKIDDFKSKNAMEQTILAGSPFVSLKTWVEYSNLNPYDLGDNLKSVDEKSQTFTAFNPLSQGPDLLKLKTLNNNIRGGGKGAYNIAEQFDDLLAYTSSKRYEVNTYYNYLQSGSSSGWERWKSTWGATEEEQRAKLLDIKKSYRISGREYSKPEFANGVYKEIVTNNNASMRAMTVENLWLYRYYYGAWSNPPEEYSKDKAMASKEMIYTGGRNDDKAIFSNQSTALMLQTKVTAPQTYLFMLTNVSPGFAQQAQQILSTDYSHYMQVSMVGAGPAKGFVYLNTIVQTAFTTLVFITAIMALLNVGLVQIAINLPINYFKAAAAGNIYLFISALIRYGAFFLLLWSVMYSPELIIGVLSAVIGNVSTMAAESFDSLIKKSGSASFGPVVHYVTFAIGSLLTGMFVAAWFKSPSFRKKLMQLFVYVWDVLDKYASKYERMAPGFGKSTDRLIAEGSYKRMYSSDDPDNPYNKRKSSSESDGENGGRGFSPAPAPSGGASSGSGNDGVTEIEDDKDTRRSQPADSPTGPGNGATEIKDDKNPRRSRPADGLMGPGNGATEIDEKTPQDRRSMRTDRDGRSGKRVFEGEFKPTPSEQGPHTGTEIDSDKDKQPLKLDVNPYLDNPSEVDDSDQDLEKTDDSDTKEIITPAENDKTGGTEMEDDDFDNTPDDTDETGDKQYDVAPAKDDTAPTELEEDDDGDNPYPDDVDGSDDKEYDVAPVKEDMAPTELEDDNDSNLHPDDVDVPGDKEYDVAPAKDDMTPTELEDDNDSNSHLNDVDVPDDKEYGVTSIKEDTAPAELEDDKSMNPDENSDDHKTFGNPNREVLEGEYRDAHSPVSSSDANGAKEIEAVKDRFEQDRLKRKQDRENKRQNRSQKIGRLGDYATGIAKGGAGDMINQDIERGKAKVVAASDDVVDDLYEYKERNKQSRKKSRERRKKKTPDLPNYSEKTRESRPTAAFSPKNDAEPVKDD